MNERTEKAFSLKLLRFFSNDGYRVWFMPTLAVLLSLIVMSIFIWSMGKNPLDAIAGLLKGCGFLAKSAYGDGKGVFTDFMAFLDAMGPMILASLAIIVAFRAGMFNIGVSGQMVAAAFVATIVVGYSGLDAYLAKPLVLLIAMAAGGLMGAFVGYLKYAFNVHEVVSTIMINYIVSYVTGFFINGFYVDTVTRSSKIISSSARLTIQNVEMFGYHANLPLGIFIAAAMAVLVWFFLNKTVIGMGIRAVGISRTASRYAGISVVKNMVWAMALSGILAGLAGVLYYLGYYNTMIPKDLPDIGYDSIAVAFLGNLSPVGSLFASAVVTIFQRGSVYMSSQLKVAREIASVMTGILLLISACNRYLWDVLGAFAQRMADKHNKKTNSFDAAQEEEEVQK
jgi:simple sugar transport system permease protein